MMVEIIGATVRQIVSSTGPNTDRHKAEGRTKSRKRFFEPTEGKMDAADQVTVGAWRENFFGTLFVSVALSSDIYPSTFVYK
jgi:hypothetical protein